MSSPNPLKQSSFLRVKTIPSEETKEFDILKLFVNPNNEELVELYKKHVDKHNASIKEDKFPNSGFDIFIPSTIIFDNKDNIDSQFINMEIKAELLVRNESSTNLSSSPYYLYPRSSISKTPLLLANHTGIIDAGYRGFLTCAFRNLNQYASYKVEKHTRLMQICHPSLSPIYVKLVESEDELSSTERGEGGFGSTGIVGVADVAEALNSGVEYERV